MSSIALWGFARPFSCVAGPPVRGRSLIKTVIAAAVAFAVVLMGITTAHATTTIYVPGTGPKPSTPATVSLEWMGPAVTHFATTAQRIGYPASLYPLEGTIALDPSVAQGVLALDAAIRALPPGESIQVIGVSQGAVVISAEQKALLADPPANTDITFVRFADPSGPGGLMGRNAGLKLPGWTLIRAPEMPYDTVYVTREYDGLADWPADQLNLLAVLNALIGATYLHDHSAYNVDLSTIPASGVTTTTNSLGATTTTYRIPTTGRLPILTPLESLGVNEKLFDAVQVPLKRIIDSAYTTSSWTPLRKALAAAGQSASLAVLNAVSRVASDIGVALRKLHALRAGIKAKTTVNKSAVEKTVVNKSGMDKTVADKTSVDTTVADKSGEDKTVADKTSVSRPDKLEKLARKNRVRAARQLASRHGDDVRSTVDSDGARSFVAGPGHPKQSWRGKRVRTNTADTAGKPAAGGTPAHDSEQHRQAG